MTNIILGKRKYPDTPRPSKAVIRPVTSTLKPAQPPKFSNPTRINKGRAFAPSRGGKQHLPPNVFERRRTRDHVAKLQELNPSGNWLEEEGLTFTPKKRKVPKPYSPNWSLDYEGNNYVVFKDEFNLKLPYPKISRQLKLVTSHVERNFNGVKMLWGREDWEENAEEVLAEEERIREKRRRERKERELRGAKSSSQRRRKLKENKRAALIKKEEQEVKAEVDQEDILGLSATEDKETQTMIDIPKQHKEPAQPTGLERNSEQALIPLALLQMKLKRKNQIRAVILEGGNQSGIWPKGRRTERV
ncbi:hypothetical protein BDZ45DRAFT_781796 [Acephala macrosclerotiorum]|nr:hypothetical protein BDZ45DRAFT_781796 [Acephala macrosclerotiorum]